MRVLANIRPDSYWMDTMLHEFGHAAYDKYINSSLPYLLRSVAHTSSTEAIALMMGGLADDPGWISRFADVAEEDLEREANVSCIAAALTSSSSFDGRL